MRPFLLIAAVAFALGLAPARLRAAEPVTVFAAASLKTALEDAGAAFTAATGIPVRFSFAASSALARQLEQGAPADLFASADEDWMVWAAARGLVRPATRVDLLGNRLVLVAPAGSGREIPLTAEAISAALGPTGRLATGEVRSVPVGRYARAALEKLGLWSVVEPRLAQAENVRAALLFVARGEAPLGIVYETDARSEPAISIVAVFPAGSHPPIVYPFALTAESKGEGPARFLAWLASPPAKAIFERQGFTTLGR